ncbi:hypothetical protein C900_05516 [Fulvivirga imtechensis AK7]|uniref:Uncharacterized protein n=1 Tax=Fulvivirga imtechensis AK7 TaxID=1237149 RepID=L8JJF1_9BACT|nr:hypothetical protein [Fulvivirga imtechensis]ELR69031.1 hypothetical protein C900_05516 [Fulvivirga imtechensis AK7]
MAFNGKEGKPITLGQAKRWTKRYRDEHPGEVKAYFFGRDHIEQLLNERSKDGASKGIRIYFAVDDDGKKRLILVAATENQNNILPTDEGKDAPATIIDDGSGCPPDCPKDPNDPLS